MSWAVYMLAPLGWQLVQDFTLEAAHHDGAVQHPVQLCQVAGPCKGTNTLFAYCSPLLTVHGTACAGITASNHAGMTQLQIENSYSTADDVSSASVDTWLVAYMYCIPSASA